MSRPIEFRAWVKDVKKYYDVVDIAFDDDGEIEWVTVLEIDGEPVSYEPNEVVLEQYTGLKDKKGVKIFENDILKYEDTFTLTGESSNIYYLAVEYNKHAEWEAGMYLLNKVYKHTEIAGNIHTSKDIEFSG